MNTNFIQELKFNDKGLLTVVTQRAESDEILMVAWADEEAINATLETGYAHYHSRSRGKLWKKGESSGNLQKVKEFFYDCDGDCLLLKVEQEGPACHTNRPNCFYNKVDLNTGEVEIITKPMV